MSNKVPKTIQEGGFEQPGYNSNLVSGTKKTALERQKRGFSEKTTKPGVTPAISKNSYRNKFIMSFKPYKLPTICRCKSGEWYIQYSYEWPDKPGIFKPFKVKGGINRIHDPKLKELAAQEVCLKYAYKLQELNYNPFEEKDIHEQAIQELQAKSVPPNWSMTEAIAQFRKFINKQNYADRTLKTYNNYIYNLEGYLKDFPDKDIPAHSFTEYDLVEFLDIQSDELEWSARTYNNYLDFYVTFFNRCKKLEKGIHRKIVYDIDISAIDSKKTTPQRNRAYTPILRDAIKEQVQKLGYNDLRDYLEWIYLCSMRPAEIRMLQFKEIDTSIRQIRIIGKTGDRLIPISDQLLKLIEKRSKSKHDHNSYIFGMAGKVSHYKMSKDYFPTQFVDIKLELGLDHTYTIYGMKPTGIQDMIRAGFSDEEIRELTGHKTVEAFRAYKRGLVIEKTHAMKGNVVDF